MAVWLPVPVAEHLAAALGREPSERWHATLAFLGDLEDPAPVVDALAAVPVPPASARLRGAGTFSRGRVLWVGAEGLDGLAASVAAALRGVVALEERPFRGHVTVARGRDLRADALEAYEGPAWTVGGFALVESAGGYRDVARFPPAPRQPALPQ